MSFFCVVSINLSSFPPCLLRRTPGHPGRFGGLSRSPSWVFKDQRDPVGLVRLQWDWALNSPLERSCWFILKVTPPVLAMSVRTQPPWPTVGRGLAAAPLGALGTVL